MLTFQVLEHKNFKIEIILFCAVGKYGMLLLICKNLKKIIRRKYRRATPRNPVFSISRCFKNA